MCVCVCAGGGGGLVLSYSFLSPFSGRSPNMTEPMVTRTLSLNSINQSNKHIFEA